MKIYRQVRVAVMVFGAMQVGATETIVRRGEALSVSPSSAGTEANVLRTMYGARGVDKSGAGAYTLPLGQVDAPDGLVVRALEGEVALAADGTLPTPEAPTAILNMASFWLDASVNLQTNADGKVLCWYDRRETQTDGTWGTAYVRAQTVTVPKNASGAEYAPVMPEAKLPPDAELPMVYFGGYTTGTGMNFLTGNLSSCSYSAVRHVFAVVDFQATYGYPVAANGNLMLHPTGFSGLQSQYNSSDSCPPATAGEFLLNGQRRNPMHTPVRKGLQLIELHALPESPMASFGRLFNDRNINGRFGGDYIGEVLVFDGPKGALSDAERRQVSRYLMAKWGIAPAQGAVAVALGEQGAARLSESVSATVSGRGAVVRSGSETGHYIPTGRNPMPGAKVRLEAGTMKADVHELAVAVKAGDTLTFGADDSWGVHTVTATTDAAARAAGQATISGATDAVRLGRVDADVTRLTVGAKEVVLGDAATGGPVLAAETGSATIANGGFESDFSAADWVWVVKNPSSGVKAFEKETDVLDWRICGAGNDLTTFKANYRLANFLPTEGKKALLLKKANVFYGHVDVARDGDYVLAFDGTGRYLYDGMQLILSLVDGNAKTNTFGCCTVMCNAGFRAYRFPVDGLKAGSYSLVVDARDGCGAANNSTDSHAVLDNFRMDFVADGLSAVGGVSVPNGSFENTRITVASRNFASFTAAGVESAGWTLTGADVPAAGAVGFASRQMTTVYLPAEQAVGEWQLRFHGGAGRATTDAFSLPAGRWKLRCKAARWSFDGAKWNGSSQREKFPQVGVRVLVNGEEAFDEVSAQVTTYDLTTFVFGHELAVTESDRIVLEVRQANTEGGFLNVDDFAFVPANAWGVATELVTDGTFASGTSNWKTTGGAWYKNLNGGYEVNYGGQQCDNAQAVVLINNASVSQDIAFPAAGTYRLSFWTRSRVSHYAGANYPNAHEYGGNMVRASLVDGDAETRIVQTRAVFSTNFNQTVALFTVPSAGTRTLRLEGVNNPTAGVWTGGNKTDANVFLDAVSVTAAPQDGAAPDLPENLELTLTGDSKLRLDYVGTVALKSLKIGGRSLVNTIDAATCPDLVSGPGSIFVQPRATLLLVR